MVRFGQGVDVIGFFCFDVFECIFLVCCIFVQVIVDYYCDWVCFVVILVVCDVFNCDVFFVGVC